MAPHLWPAKTSCLKWIKERVDGYKEALAKGTVEPWCANMIHEYFSAYHWSIPDDVEPTPGATYTEPVNKEGLDDKNAILDKKKKESWHYGDGKKKEPENLLASSSKSIPSTLLQFSHPRPRHLRLWQVYMKMYYRAKISALFEEEMERKYPNDVKSQKKLRMKEQGEFVQALYNSESTEVKDIVNQERSRLYDEALKQWEQECNANHTPEAIQSAIDHMVPGIKAFLKDLRDRTKLCATLIIGGPSLALSGQIITTHVHSGLTAGDNPLNFGEHSSKVFDEVITPAYVRFLRQVYSFGDSTSTILADTSSMSQTHASGSEDTTMRTIDQDKESNDDKGYDALFGVFTSEPTSGGAATPSSMSATANKTNETPAPSSKDYIDYEAIRAQNIERNHRLMESLGLFEAAAQVAPPAETNKTSKSKRARKCKSSAMASDDASVRSTGPNTCQKTARLSLKDPESDLASTSLSTFSSTSLSTSLSTSSSVSSSALSSTSPSASLSTSSGTLPEPSSVLPDLNPSPLVPSVAPSAGVQSGMSPNPSPQVLNPSLSAGTQPGTSPDPSLVLPGLNPLPRLPNVSPSMGTQSGTLPDPSLVPDLNPSPPVPNVSPSVGTQSGMSPDPSLVPDLNPLPPVPNVLPSVGIQSGTSPDPSLVPDLNPSPPVPNVSPSVGTPSGTSPDPMVPDLNPLPQVPNVSLSAGARSGTSPDPSAMLLGLNPLLPLPNLSPSVGTQSGTSPDPSSAVLDPSSVLPDLNPSPPVPNVSPSVSTQSVLNVSPFAGTQSGMLPDPSSVPSHLNPSPLVPDVLPSAGTQSVPNVLPFMGTQSGTLLDPSSVLPHLNPSPLDPNVLPSAGTQSGTLNEDLEGWPQWIIPQFQ
ncbi:hypothetical protein BS47DRAFT_1393239 [Hydnum rufescens UP504]|uniref:Uncharacterized protein n=1 Tax=Hydnum rufescens UP504 TaxID=1448309 RepID=A0A9P6AX70_9AGAM|nr:hypothetical protein BS47DRAFT_1393239 [Hydnum rufescens UP504]